MVRTEERKRLKERESQEAAAFCKKQISRVSNGKRFSLIC